MTTPSRLSGSLRAFLYSFVYFSHLFIISSASVRFLPFLLFMEPICAWNVALHVCVLSRFSCVQLCGPMDCSLPGSCVHGILQARIHRMIQKRFNNQHNHNGVTTHLEPDILEWEVKWALGRTTTNKASGGDGIPAELFQIQKMML